MLLWVARQYVAIVGWFARRLGTTAKPARPAIVPSAPARHRARGRNWGGYTYRTHRLGPHSVANVLYLASGPRNFGPWSMNDFATDGGWLRETEYAETPAGRTYSRALVGTVVG